MIQKKGIIEVDVRDWHLSKTFLGTEDEFFKEAFDWMNAVILDYAEKNNIYDDEEIEKIMEYSFNSVTIDNEDFLCMYAVCEEDCRVIGVYFSREEAEEAILTECEDFAEETMRESDPNDIMGKKEWDYKDDYWWLVKDAGGSFFIQTVPVYGVNMIED